MRAAVYEAGSTDLTIGDVDIDDPAPGRVRVRVHHCGICHSDYTALHSTYGASPSVLGHEAAGVVEAVGAGVDAVAPGDEVVIAAAVACGRCRACTTGRPGECTDAFAPNTPPFTWRGGSRKTVSAKFSSRARLCICSVVKGRPSTKTPS